MTQNDSSPWWNMKIPDSQNEVLAHLVNPSDPWNFYWAKSATNKLMFILKHENSSSKDVRLPKLRDIDIRLVKLDKEYTNLMFTLNDSSHEEVFYSFCLDIVERCNSATTEKDAVDYALNRTWRWHHLLRGGSRKLSNEEQKGLIGELLVLQKIMLQSVSAKDAVASWLGPKGSPKDFQFGAIAIEAKARRGGAVPHISISNEHQLDGTGINNLFLHVTELDRQSQGKTDSFTVTDKVKEVREEIELADPGAINDYDDLITSSGFDYEDDYSDTHWILMNRNIYEVTDEFPRIVASDLRSGVINVAYSISLTECEAFRCNDDLIFASLGVNNNDRN